MVSSCRSRLPNHVAAQCLAGLSPVDDDGTQTEQSYTRLLLQLGLLVSVHQVAGALLQGAGHTTGHHVLDAVEHFKTCRFCSHVLQRNFTLEAETVAGSPLPAEAQLPVLIYLFKDDTVANAALIQVALQAELCLTAH